METKKIIITRKMKIETDNLKEFKLTSDLVNKAKREYLSFLLEHKELLNLPIFKCFNEVMQNLKIRYLPVRLTNAVIKVAIGQAKILTNRFSNRNVDYDIPIRFYKKTYKYLDNNQMSFQLFNGEKWEWYIVKVQNLSKLDNEKKLSPVVNIKKNIVEVSIPIEKTVEDIESKKKEFRKDNNLKVCGIIFTNTNNFVVCVALDNKGNLIKSKFISGGNQYKDKITKILGNIKKLNRKDIKYNDNKRHWQKYKRLNRSYAHYVSNEIIKFCKENKLKVISITKSNDDNLKDFQDYRYKPEPIELCTRTQEYLNYKAILNGILIIESKINAYNKCYKCLGSLEKKENLQIECINGHKGDYYFNAAMNVGRTALRKLGKKI